MKEEKELHENTGKLVLKLASNCIANNYYRENNHSSKGWFYFDQQYIQKFYGNKECPFDRGYMFLDKKGEAIGMIKIYAGDLSFRWNFWEINAKITCEYY